MADPSELDRDNALDQAASLNLQDRQGAHVIEEDIENIVRDDSRIKNLELQAEREAGQQIEALDHGSASLAAPPQQSLDDEMDEHLLSLREQSEQDFHIDDHIDPQQFIDNIDELDEQRIALEGDQYARQADAERVAAQAQRRDTARNALQQQFQHDHTTGSYFTKASKTLVMKERDNAITAPRQHTPESSLAIVQLAEAKGWQSLNVKGTTEFRRDVWMQASLRGMPVRGYEPTEKDKEALTREMERTSQNRITEIRPPEREKALNERYAAAANVMDIYLEEKVQDPADREAIRAAFQEALAAKRATGKEPNIRIYDPAASKDQSTPAKEQEIDKEKERDR
jgi:Large polyvalent protein-associated domain 7